MEHAPKSAASLVFGRFQVVPHRRELLAGGQALKLGGRAYDVLITLIEARGAVVGKDALMARVWPDRMIEENAIQVQISALRAALGPDRDLIRTVAGRGYQFTGEINPLPPRDHQHASPATVAPAAGPATPRGNLAEPLSALIGRDDELREVINLAAAHRFVTLSGPGGIGKTRLALAVAREKRPEFVDGVWFVDFSPLADPALVPATVASAAGLELRGDAGSPERVASALRGKHLLIVLDNCEHVIDAAAVMAEALVRANPGTHVIGTSREPLRAEGEWVYAVPPLAVPPPPRATPAEASGEAGDPRQFGAVRLFLERVCAVDPRFAPDRQLVSVIVTICQRLDGIPLAIELAAARAGTLGVTEVAARLGDRFNLLTGGRRTALPRHQTLRATLDWSHELLDEPERVILRRVAIFAGGFSLEAANALAASDIIPAVAPTDVTGIVIGLVAKSLLATDRGGAKARFRLPETTRAYALAKLQDSGERAELRRLHAVYYRDLMQAAWTTSENFQFASAYGAEIDNVRAALAWAFSADGDRSVAVALAADTAPIWLEMSKARCDPARLQRAMGNHPLRFRPLRRGSCALGQR